MVHGLVIEYTNTGKVPEAVAGAVMNIADDMLAGRDVVIRAGDYIALMTHAREQKLL